MASFMSQDLATAGPAQLEPTDEPLLPTKEELSVLSTTEAFAVRLVRRMNTGPWKVFWTFCQRHIGSLWIYLATYNLMNVFGIENVAGSDPARPLVLVSNHRSF